VTKNLFADVSSRIEGVGRPQVESSFQADVVGQIIRVPDAASIATMLWLDTLIGRKLGVSIGTNLLGVFQVTLTMIEKQQSGSIVTLMCDSTERYLDIYYDSDWEANNIGDLKVYTDQLPPRLIATFFSLANSGVN
jgi:cysteine synthase A